MGAYLKHCPEYDLEVGVFRGAISADEMLQVYSGRAKAANWLGVYCEDADLSGVDVARLPTLKRAVTAAEGELNGGEPRLSALVNLSASSELFVRFWVHYASQGVRNARRREMFSSIEAASQWLGLTPAASTALTALVADVDEAKASDGGAEETERRRMILRAASRLFRERGFDAITVPEILDAAGVACDRARVDGESKDDLIVHALLYAIGDVVPLQGRLADYAAAYLSPAQRADLAGGCAMAALASETVRKSAEARTAMTAGLAWHIERLSRIAPGEDPAARRRAAIRAWSAMVGALILARVTDGDALSKEVMDETLGWVAGPAVTAAGAATLASLGARPS